MKWATSFPFVVWLWVAALGAEQGHKPQHDGEGSEPRHLELMRELASDRVVSAQILSEEVVIEGNHPTIPIPVNEKQLNRLGSRRFWIGNGSNSQVGHRSMYPSGSSLGQTIDHPRSSNGCGERLRPLPKGLL